MLTIQQILRLVEVEANERLVERILANGRCDAPEIARRLARPDVVVPAALGLALQRCAELSYGPTAVAGALVGRLLDQKRGDGLFGSSSIESRFIASAIALRGLAEFARAASSAGASPTAAAHAALNEVKAALARLIAAADSRWLSPLPAAVVLWQLRDRPDLRADWPAGAWAALVHRAESAAAPRSLHRFALAFAA